MMVTMMVQETCKEVRTFVDILYWTNCMTGIHQDKVRPNEVSIAFENLSQSIPIIQLVQ